MRRAVRHSHELLRHVDADSFAVYQFNIEARIKIRRPQRQIIRGNFAGEIFFAEVGPIIRLLRIGGDQQDFSGESKFTQRFGGRDPGGAGADDDERSGIFRITTRVLREMARRAHRPAPAR